MASDLNRLEDVLMIVGSQFKLDREELVSLARTKRLHRPRQMAMYLSHKMTAATPDQIGSAFSGRDHTVVEMHCRAIANARQQDITLDRVARDLERAIKRYWALP